MHSRIRLLALLVLAAACTGAEPRQLATVRDSAGVEIVESSGGSWGERGWRLDTTPVFDIGGRDDDPNQDLLQVGDVLRLPGGRIAVGNGGTAEIRIYDSTGTFISALGRKGEGPGEFLSIGMLELGPGDSIYVYDYMLRRMSVLAPDGTYVRSATVTATAGGQFLSPQGRLPDGSWATHAQPPMALEGDFTGVRRDTMRFVRLTPDLSTVADTIASYPGMEMYIQRTSGSTTYNLLPFGLNSPVAATAGKLYVGDPANYEIRVHRGDGTLERIVRRPVSREPVTPADVDAARERALSAIVDDRARALQAAMWEGAPIPKLRPAMGGMNVDSEGRIWVQDYAPDPAEPKRTAVFDTDGKLLGHLTIPGGLRVLDIGPGLLIGLWRDDDGVEHVRGFVVGRGGRADGR